MSERDAKVSGECSVHVACKAPRIKASAKWLMFALQSEMRCYHATASTSLIKCFTLSHLTCKLMNTSRALLFLTFGMQEEEEEEGNSVVRRQNVL